jgi:uncharacterized membrane protein
LTSAGEVASERLWGLTGRQWIWLICAVGTVLRLIALGHKSFWIDEIASVSIAQKPSAAFWHFLWHDEGNMALYYALLRPWLHFGKTEAVVRLLTVIPGVATIPLMCLAGKRLFGRDLGILAAALFALNPCAIASSQEARAYSFLVLAVVLSTCYFISLVERPSYRVAVIYGMVAGFTCYFHFFGVLVPAAHAISLLALPASRRPVKQFLLAASIFVVLAMPVLWLIHAQDIGHISWVQAASLLEFYHLGVFLAANGGKAVGAALLALDLPLIGFFLTKLFSVWQERDEDLQRWRYSLIASLFFSPIFITLAVSIVRPAFYHRFLVICLPAFVMMTAVGILQNSGRAWRTAVVVGVCLLSLMATVVVYTHAPEDWRGAVRYMIAHAHPDDRVLYYQGVGYFAGQNYRGWLPGGSEWTPVEIAVNGTDRSWKQEIQGSSRVWLVLYRAKADDSASRAIEQELLKSHDAAEEKTFRGITVMEYNPKR